MYACGPTPYAPAHIGHAYSASSFDPIRRSLVFLGFDVTYVRNITDVDDKINAAKAANEDPLERSRRFTDEYNRDMAMFSVLAPDIEPKVSTHIEQIIALTERLIARGKAYEVEGDVYFEVATFPGYGKLSGQSPDELESGARVAVDSAEARARRLRAAKPGEPSWDSLWGKGRPGWHIECSAMTWAHLGESFDIHGGGKDPIFPHHENEIAQSQGAFGEDSFARYWMHNGFLNFEGEKMSRSEGNVFACHQIDEAVGAEALRLFFVSHHHRSPIDFEPASRPATPPARSPTKFPSLDRPPPSVLLRDAAAARRLRRPRQGRRRRRGRGAARGRGAGRDRARGARRRLQRAGDDRRARRGRQARQQAPRRGQGHRQAGAPPSARARLARDLRAVGAALGILHQDPATYLRAATSLRVKKRGLDVTAIDRLLADRTAGGAAKDFARAESSSATSSPRSAWKCWTRRRATSSARARERLIYGWT